MHHTNEIHYNKCGCDCSPKKHSHKKEKKEHKKSHKEHKCHKKHCYLKQHKCNTCLRYYPNQQSEYAYTYNVERVQPNLYCYLYTKCNRQYFRCCYSY